MPSAPTPYPAPAASERKLQQRGWLARFGLLLPIGRAAATVPLSAASFVMQPPLPPLSPEFLLTGKLPDSPSGMLPRARSKMNVVSPTVLPRMATAKPTWEGAASAIPTRVREPSALASAIRRHLPMLAAEDAQRHVRMLASILQTADAAKHPELLRMLAANVIGNVRRQRAHSSRAGTWQKLAATTVGLRFAGDVKQLSEQKEAELLTLRAQILTLPVDMARPYELLLRDILRGDDLRLREQLLRSLSQHRSQATSARNEDANGPLHNERGWPCRNALQ